MTFSKQLFLLFFILFFLFPLRHASNPYKCSSSFERPLRCGPLEVPIRFPFCDHAGFNLLCTNLNATVLQLPMSGTFVVRHIDYGGQQIFINDPENCLAKRLLTLNISGSPFSSRFDMFFTLLACPNEVVLPSWSPSIPCLNNSTTSFFATFNFAIVQSMLPSCQIVRRLHAPADWPFQGTRFWDFFSGDLMLKWDSPNCRGCERNRLRCGFKNKASLKIRCFGSGGLPRGVQVLLICLSIIGAVTLFATCIVIRMRNHNSRRRPHLAIAASASSMVMQQQPREVMAATRGLDQSTIETYKKMEFGESKRLSGTNGIVCPICLSEYASKDIVRFIPECEHCFHVECIDVWLKMHGSCPLCRNSRAL